MSVIIPTLDRCQHVLDLLQALRWQTMSSFEVVLVVGPCSDETEKALHPFANSTRIVHNPERNVSMSRNIGASAAMGDILAFIDDDEVPEPTWLEDLVAGFVDETVGAVGGAVLGVNGRDLDWLYCSADMYGTAYLSVDEPTHLQRTDADDPARERLQYSPGGNCAVRRAALNSIGGFDEAIVYYLDETDMFFRLQMAGWTMRQLEGARVHHLQLAGIVRDADDQKTTNWVTILQSRVTFAGKYAVALVGSQRVIDELGEWARHVRATFSDSEQLENFNREVGVGETYLRNLDGGHHATHGSSAHFENHNGDRSRVVQFPTIPGDRFCHIVVVCRHQVTHRDAVAEIELARSYADRGHIARLIAASDRSVTRWVDGLWVHEIASSADDCSWDQALVNELRRIDDQMQITFVMADGLPISDVGWMLLHPPATIRDTDDELAPSAGFPSIGSRASQWVTQRIRAAARTARTLVEPPVFVRLIGGAGNELFQYAAALTLGGEKRARALASNRGSNQLHADSLVPGFVRYAGRRSRRVLDLLTQPTEPHQSSWRDRLVKPAQRAVADRTIDQHGELRKAVSPPISRTKRPVLLDGYFQHPDWYRPGDAIIIRELRANAPSRWADLAASKYAVVSFRRGDFETLGWAASDSYYDMALCLVGTNLPLAVVGDDQAYVASKRREYRERGFEILIPEQLAADDAVSDFWTIAGAQTVVMSNSTFCWWATRLGDSAWSSSGGERMVLCPRIWIPGLDTHLVQPSWIVVDPRSNGN